MSLATAGYLRVQSLPRRVRMLTRPASRRACIRYPSNFISWSQSVPSGAAFTSAASSGLIQVGGRSWIPLLDHLRPMTRASSGLAFEHDRLDQRGVVVLYVADPLADRPRHHLACVGSEQRL